MHTREPDEIWTASRPSQRYELRREEMPLIHQMFYSSRRSRKSSRTRSVTATLHRRSRDPAAELPLMPGKLSVLLDTDARRGVTSRRHSSKIVDNLSRIGGNFPSYVYAIEREERFSPSASFSLFLSRLDAPRLSLSLSRTHPRSLNRCINGCFSTTIRSYPEVVTPHPVLLPRILV